MNAPVPLAELAQELLLCASQIAEGHSELPDAPTANLKIKAALERFQQEARRAGHSPGDIDDARYALTALIDEVIQFSQWSGKLEWASRPLQAELYNERMAGVRFYERLEVVRQRSPGVLEVYHLCLGLGFLGRHRIGKSEELPRIMAATLAGLEVSGGEELSPDGVPRLQGGGRRRPFPGLVIGLSVLGLSLLIGLGLLAYTRQSAANAAERIGAVRS
ncbi:MAG: DotU family type IV/VI secretion system protein [Deltaproteobacteria bacterium]|jgi:type IV/VI secretion system ImpK/VasF family protein|nr:DotU family type IV/VI secretion system protein [Deltaproteobacteria bacterium]